jgi:hypothetical protein
VYAKVRSGAVVTMTGKQCHTCVIAGLLVATGLAVVAVMWGLHGIEVASWLAAVGSLLVAVLTLVVTWPRDKRPHVDGNKGSSSGVRPVSQSARARGKSTVIQAGGSITNSGNSGNES